MNNHFTKQKLPSNRKFGFFFTFIFILAGSYLFINNYYLLSYFLYSFAIILLFITSVKDSMLLPLNKIWMNIGFFIGKIINPIILGIIYFIMFTPTSLFMKIIQRDELKLRFKVYRTNWKIRNSKDSEIINFNKQF